MVKNFLFYFICLLPFGFGVKIYSDIVRHNDERGAAIMACMHELLQDDSYTAPEAYDICKEVNR